MNTIHDEDCEADWGPEGQESPCRCWERADERISYASLGAQVAAAVEAMETFSRAFAEVSEGVARVYENITRAYEAIARMSEDVQDYLDTNFTPPAVPLPPGLTPEKYMVGRVYITDSGAAWNVAPRPDGTYHWEPCQWQKS